jgi:hypothetical protein
MTSIPARPFRLASLLLIALALTGCTITFLPGDVTLRGTIRFGIEVSDIITRFEPTRGAGAAYRPGDSIAFVIRTTTDGYITLTSISPDGTVYVFQRNVFVRGGVDTIIPTRGNFIVSSRGGRDFGVNRVRATITPSPTDVRRVTYQGVRGEAAWTQRIIIEIEPYPVAARDVRETSFVIVR